MNASARFDAWALPPGLPDPGRTAELPSGPGGGVLRRAVLSTSELDRLLGHLSAAGEALRDIPVAAVARTLGAVGARFGREGDALRSEALRLLPAFAGTSPAQARHVLDGMARDWTPERLERVLAMELGQPALLDGFVRISPPSPGPPGRILRAFGPRLAVHVCAGTVPGVGVTSLMRGLLVKGPVLLKPGAGDAVLPALLARALAGEGHAGRRLAEAVAVLYWPGGSRDLERAVLGAADLAVVYGSDETVRALRGHLRPSTRLVAYPHRVSVAVVGPADLPIAPGDEGAAADEGTADPEATEVGEETAAALAGAAAARSLARAVASFDQRGCVSPHQVFLLEAGYDAARRFARALASALMREATVLPPGPLEAAEASAVQQVRGTAELRRAAGEPVEMLTGADLGWTVVVDTTPTFRPSCLSRTVHVTPVPGTAALVSALDPVRDHLQSVGLAGLGGSEAEVVEALARLGATRFVPLDELPFPPAWWMHDGQGPLTSLVRWTEWAQTGV